MTVKVVDYTVVGMFFCCCKFNTIPQITVREAEGETIFLLLLEVVLLL